MVQAINVMTRSSGDDYFEDYGDALAAALRAVVEKLGYEYHYHMDDGEGGIQYNCKNTIIDVNELNEIIHELEETK